MLISGHIYPELRSFAKQGLRTLFKHKNYAPYSGLHYNQHYRFSNQDNNNQKDEIDAKNYNQSNPHTLPGSNWLIW